MRSKNAELEKNQLSTSLDVFIENYNKLSPKGFPRATVTRLKKFQETHPTLFKDNDQWSIDKHRKRLMDWLFSQVGTPHVS